MTKNISKIYFNKIDKILNTFFINLLDDISINNDISKDDIQKYYPEAHQKKLEKKKKKNDNDN